VTSQQILHFSAEKYSLLLLSSLVPRRKQELEKTVFSPRVSKVLSLRTLVHLHQVCKSEPSCIAPCRLNEMIQDSMRIKWWL
jgi:hypothetical protein